MAKLTGWQPKRWVRQEETEEPEIEYNPNPDTLGYTEFERVQTLTTRGKLLKRFYDWNNTNDGMKPWITMAMDPDFWTPDGEHNWWIAHFQEYHVKIEMQRGRPSGIHRARLFYRQRSGRVLWLATYQFGPVYFFSQGAIAMEYLTVLHKHSWFIAPREVDKVVPM